MEKKLVRQGSVSENFFTVSNASLILPKKGSPCEPVKNMKSLKFGGHLKTHLYAIMHIVRPQDQIKLVARLESWEPLHIRYLVIVSTMGRQDTEESVVLGVDFAKDEHTKCTIGLAMPIWNDMNVQLDGDGGFNLTIKDQIHMFKPASVQAMWSALQALHHCIDIAHHHNYFNGSLYLTWTCYYESRISSSRIFLNEWEHNDFVWTRRPNYYFIKDSQRESIEHKIRGKLKEVMMKMDLDNCTSRDIRTEMEKDIDLDLKEYKGFIDEEMIIILRQMDTASKILDFLYLGSEWNAANIEELTENGITHILNITIEVDNYFPDDFVYKNIRLWDMDKSDLLHEWNNTYKFIKGACRQGGKCLVHCKMGISRSASTVIAFIMKDMKWSMEKAMKFVSEKRPIIMPNDGFMAQLHEYEGILNASNQRHNILFRSLSESNLTDDQANAKSDDGDAAHQSNPKGKEVSFDFNRQLLDLTNPVWRSRHKRSKSWTLGDSKLDEDVAAIFTELCGDQNTEPLSEPQNLNLQSSDFDKNLAYRLRNSDSKGRRKFKRRHTEKVLSWQSSDFGLRSDESMVANSDCGIPTRFSWEQSTVESNEDHLKSFGQGRGYSETVTSPVSRMNIKGTAMQSETIDEVFEQVDSSTKETSSPAESSFVKSLVNNIEAQYGESGDRGNLSSSSAVEHSSPPQKLSTLENPNTNNNNSCKTLQNNSDTAETFSKVVIIHSKSSSGDAGAVTKGFHTLSQNELQVIREVGMTFIGEIPSTDDHFLKTKGDCEEGTDDKDAAKVRKGLVRRMARAIENRVKQTMKHGLGKERPVREAGGSLSSEIDMKAVKVIEKNDEKADPATVAHSTQHATDDLLNDEKLHLFSFDAPMPYILFQKRFRNGKILKKSISFDAYGKRRGVSRSQSDRATSYKPREKTESTKSEVQQKVPVEIKSEDENEIHQSSITNDTISKDMELRHKKKSNPINRQNALYKTI